MQTSREGIAFLERHEGVVLKAYRDPVGVLTIGAGLTKASGVVDPKPGMVITQQDATALLKQALERNYEPAVAEVMLLADQNEFDAGVSFHFNTGAIGRASWVGAWMEGEEHDTRDRLKRWRKAGGRVLPGLVRRRVEEFNLLWHGVYGPIVAPPRSSQGQARIVLALDAAEISNMRAAFRRLGYDPGAMPGRMDADAVRQFQADHDLTVDGIIGRATLSTLQRMIDARSKAAGTGATTAAGGSAAAGSGALDAVAGTEALLLGAGVVAVGAVCLGVLAWRYRDAIAVKVQGRFPALAERLRSW